MSMLSARLSFIVEHYDTLAQMVKKYQLFFYPEDASIEMYDIKNQRIFLKRIINPEVKTTSLYIGSEISIYSRQYKIIAFADEFTKKSFENVRTSVFALILPSAYMLIGKIIDIIQRNGFLINKLKMNKLSSKESFNFLKIHNSNSNEITPEFLGSDFIVGMELIKSNALVEIEKLAREEINTLTKENTPIMIYSNDYGLAQQEINYYFSIATYNRIRKCRKINRYSIK